MENNFLNKNNVLVLNALYIPIGITSVQKAIISMCSEGTEQSARSIDVTYAKLPDGKLNLDKVETFCAYSFQEWLMVDFREGLDTAIHTSKIQLRCPTVLITSYAKIPMKKFRPTKQVLFGLQKGKTPNTALCGYSLKELPFSQLNIEHKIARSHGGKNSWENLMLVNKKINSERGNKNLAEVGLQAHFHHREPRPIPVSYTIKHVAHNDWLTFLNK